METKGIKKVGSSIVECNYGLFLCLIVPFKNLKTFFHMAKKSMLPTGLTERPQLIVFSWSPDNGGIIKPWLSVDREWVQQADLPAGAPVAISVETICSLSNNRLMEIQDIIERLSITQVLRHYGLQPDKNNRCCARSTMAEPQACRSIRRRILFAASAVTAMPAPPM